VRGGKTARHHEKSLWHERKLEIEIQIQPEIEIEMKKRGEWNGVE